MAEMKLAGVVYLFRCGLYYKIGQTQTDVLQRLRAVQHGNPHEVELVHSFPSEASYRAEKFLHLKFASKRVRNEWFELEKEDVEWICKIKHISNEFLERYNLNAPKGPAKHTAIQRKCEYCGRIFKAEGNRSEWQKYCNIICQERADRQRKKLIGVYNPLSPAPYQPRKFPTDHKYQNCIVCGAPLPKGFGPCCSRECAFSFRQQN